MKSPLQSSRRPFIAGATLAALGATLPPLRAAAGAKSGRAMARVPGKFPLRLRECRKPAPSGLAYEPAFRALQGKVSDTAIRPTDSK